MTIHSSLLFSSIEGTILGTLMGFLSLFLILLVLVQRGKGGGLTGALGGPGGQSAFGSKAGDTFTVITVAVATVWAISCAFTMWLLGTHAPPATTADSTVQSGGGDVDPSKDQLKLPSLNGDSNSLSPGISGNDEFESGSLELTPATTDEANSDVPANPPSDPPNSDSIKVESEATDLETSVESKPAE